MRTKKIVVGKDFKFGKNRSGDVDNIIREFRGIYRKIDPERDLDPPSGRSPFWKRYDPEEVADNIVEEMDS